MTSWLFMSLICGSAEVVGALRLASYSAIEFAEHMAGVGNQPKDCWITEKRQSYNIQFKIKASFSCNFFIVFSNQKLSKADWQMLVVEKTFTAKETRTKKGDDACICTYNSELSHIFSPGKFPGETGCDPKSCFRAYSALMYIAARHTRDKSIHPGEIHTATHWTVSGDGDGDTKVPLLREEVDKLKQTIGIDKAKLDIVLANAGEVATEELIDELEVDNEADTRSEDSLLLRQHGGVPSILPGKSFTVEPSINDGDSILASNVDVEEFLRLTDEHESIQDGLEENPENLGSDRHVENPDAGSLRRCKEVVKVIWKLSREAGALNNCSCALKDTFRIALSQIYQYQGYAYIDPSIHSLSKRDWNEACTIFGDFLSKDGRLGRIQRRMALLQLADSAYGVRVSCSECDLNQLEYTTMSFVNTILSAVIRPGTMDRWQPRD